VCAVVTTHPATRAHSFSNTRLTAASSLNARAPLRSRRVTRTAGGPAAPPRVPFPAPGGTSTTPQRALALHRMRSNAPRSRSLLGLASASGTTPPPRSTRGRRDPGTSLRPSRRPWPPRTRTRVPAGAPRRGAARRATRARVASTPGGARTQRTRPADAAEGRARCLASPSGSVVLDLILLFTIV
jgi:hypothetical protein